MLTGPAVSVSSAAQYNLFCTLTSNAVAHSVNASGAGNGGEISAVKGRVSEPAQHSLAHSTAQHSIRAWHLDDDPLANFVKTRKQHSRI